MEPLTNTSDFGNQIANYTIGESQLLKTIESLQCGIGILIALINLVGIIGLWRTQKIAKQVKALAINIAFSDLASGLVMVISYFHIQFSWDSEDLWNCHPRKYLTVLFILSALFSATSLAIDRFISVKFAMKYQLHITIRKTIAFCIFLWITAGLFTVVYSSGYADCTTILLDSFQRVFFIISVVPCLCLILVSYIGIILVTRKTIARISTIDVRSRRDMLRQNLKPSLKIIAISCVYIMTYLSLVTLLIIMSIEPEIKRIDILMAFGFVILSFQWLINPFIYAWRFKEFRIQMLFIFCYCKKDLREKAIKMRKVLLEPYMECYNLRPRRLSNV